MNSTARETGALVINRDSTELTKGP